MGCIPRPRRLEGRLTSLVLEHPLPRKLSRLDVAEDPPHLLAGLRRDDPRTGHIFSVLGRIRDGVVHVRDATLIDQIDNQLHFVETFEISHFWRVAGFDQGFVTRADQFDETATENALLSEKIGFALFAKRRFDNARAAAPNGAGIGKTEFVCVAARVLMHRYEARNAATSLVFASNRVPGPLWRNHRSEEH